VRAVSSAPRDKRTSRDETSGSRRQTGTRTGRGRGSGAQPSARFSRRNCEKRRQFRWAEWRAKQTVVARRSRARVSARSDRFLPATEQSRGGGGRGGRGMIAEAGDGEAAGAR